ncbi:mitochondrial import inner membrane translocase subunit TIM44-like [Oppia nitens]|uniref:mitochondrial import inner membrane translocase subunit TIM44-like n=1 Tax=Oppia nitens TaxID=1686743 RepID=UPI0023DB5EA4|nr:mitochondrial import inner membrane translocase subunit TIM44-like [Oppia nitens]
MNYLLRVSKPSITLSSICMKSNWFAKEWTCLHKINTRLYSQQSPQGKSFLGKLVENIKQEISKNKEMKESLKKFREETQKLEESDALKKARHKYQTIESETSKGSQQIIDQLEAIKGKISKGLEEAQKTEIGKKAGEVADELSKQARSAAQVLGKGSEQLSQSDAFKTVSQTVKAVREEMTDGNKVYKRPEKLRKRKEESEETFSHQKPIEPNETATGVELHKDSRWYQSWQNFKDNNPYVNKIFDWKMKYDESDNPVVRASRLITDKVTELFGGLFSKTELSEVLTEVCKIDPNFDKNQFLKECETDIIPNILEAMIRPDLGILKDWLHEAPYNQLAQPILQAQQMGYKFESRVLDLENVDLAMGKMMDSGPVLIITFQTQQINCIRDLKGNVIEGDPEKILRVHYVWVLCRDQNEFDPKACWKLMDLSASSAQQWL